MLLIFLWLFKRVALADVVVSSSASTAAPLNVDPQLAKQSSSTQRLHPELQQGEGEWEGAGPNAAPAATEVGLVIGQETMLTCVAADEVVVCRQGMKLF